MKFVVQRVKSASLRVNGELVSEIGRGLVVYIGVKQGDAYATAEKCAEKIANLRVFPDENGKLNLSVKDVGGEILVVSNFTLYGDISHGNRPSFTEAESARQARLTLLGFELKLAHLHIPYKCGVFGADMQILQENDGPVTIVHEVL